MNNVNQLIDPSIFMVCLKTIFKSQASLNRLSPLFLSPKMSPKLIADRMTDFNIRASKIVFLCQACQVEDHTVLWYLSDVGHVMFVFAFGLTFVILTASIVLHHHVTKNKSFIPKVFDSKMKNGPTEEWSTANGYNDVGDGCCKRNLLVTNLRCWWRIW